MKLIIDTSMGTRVLGSKFGHLQLTQRHDQYDHAVSASLNYYSDWWLLARVDDGIIDYYADQVKRKFGVKLHVPNSINIPQTVYQMDVPSTPYYGVWYNVVLQQAGQLSINTNGTIGDLDTMLGLYAANGTLIATNDDGGDEALSMITSILPAGTYYFVVTQYQTTFFDSRFDFQCFEPIPTGIKISATF